MVLELVLLSTQLMTVTSYRSVPEQTDDSPFYTSIGEHVAPGGCAVSRDLLKSGQVKYGDYLYIEGYGLCRANDTMHRRHTKHVDVWKATYAEEKSFGVRRACVWKVKFPAVAVSAQNSER